MRKYIDFVQTVKPDALHDDKISLKAWLDVLDSFEYSGNQLDRIKKAVAYGKEPVAGPGLRLSPKYTDRRLDPVFLAVEEDTLHGILGIATEAAELAAIIRNPAPEGIDKTNLLEELGDVMWYIALIAEDHGWSFEDIMETNMAKLKKRFPEKFTEEAAINRNVEAEREVLEQEEARIALDEEVVTPDRPYRKISDPLHGTEYE